MDVSGFVAMSHAPYWDLNFEHRGPGDRYVAAVAHARHRISLLRPDILVIFGPDHFRNFFYDAMPPFCVGTEAVVGFGDYGSPKGPLPGAPELGRFVVEYVMADGFDPAISLRMGVDHGVTQAYAALAGDRPVAVLPIMVNCSGAAMASMRRCHGFGRAVGRAIRAFSSDLRVVVAGSGGLSHSPPSGSPYDPSLGEKQRDYVINGRSRVTAHNAALEAKVAEYRDAGVTGPVNEDWDAWFLSQLMSGCLEPLLTLTNEQLVRDGGIGAHELRAWMAAIGAWDRPVESSVYEAVPDWITGMGCVVAGAAA